MSNVCGTILAICSLIGIFVAVAIESTGIMIFLCVIFTLLCTDAVKVQKKEEKEEDVKGIAEYKEEDE